MESASKQGGALHGAVLLVVIVPFGVLPFALSWPEQLLLPLLVYAVIVLAWPRLRRTAPRIAVGRVGGWPLVAAAIFAVATVVGLVLFQTLARPDVADLAARLPVTAFGNLLLAGICFSVINATLEEFVFRGILWGIFAAEWNSGIALGSTTVLFGLGHLQGYPPGLLGAVLAGCFGLAMGLLRWWTDGLGLAIAVHVCADATIFGLLCWSGTIH